MAPVIIAVMVSLMSLSCTKAPEKETEPEKEIKPKEAQITTGTLLKELIDRDAIARFPSPAYIESSFSSYDRASVAKGQDWYANDDKNEFIRIEQNQGRTEFVLFDADGPGAITRWWMTFDGARGGYGIMRVYIDGDTNPAIVSTPFQMLSGQRLSKEPLASSVSKETEYERRGQNLYYPIAYEKHCKVTYSSDYLSPDGLHKAKGGETVYYNIEYRTYEPGTTVASYSKDENDYYQNIEDEVNAALLLHEDPLGDQKSLGCTLEPGKSFSVELSGPGAMRYIAMRLKAADVNQALRSTLLEIEFDSEKTVWIPIGEFFGVGYKQLDVDMWNVTANSSGNMEARWTMPYSQNATLTISNHGTQTVTIDNAELRSSDWDFDSSSMHFHALWKLYYHINTRTDPVTGFSGSQYDMNFVNLEGKGVYVGDAMTLYNTSAGWWGEGDEKIYPDGVAFPSIFGTGTEDYYGYAWGRSASIVGHPFLSQPSGAGNAAPGYTVNARHRNLDRIPFRNSLVLDMEMWHWYDVQMDLGVSTFFYMLPGGKVNNTTDDSSLATKVSLSNFDFIPDLTEDKIDIEAEYLNLESCTGGNYAIQTDYAQYWSNGAQVFWNHIPVGSELELSFDSPYAGSYSLAVLYAYSWDYGKFDVWFNGEKIDTRRSFQNSSIKTAITNYGPLTVVKGKNTFKFKAVATGSGYDQAYFGLDRVTFTK